MSTLDIGYTVRYSYQCLTSPFCQVHCLQFLIYEVVSGGNMRKPGGIFGNSGSEIPINDLKQLETFFYKLGFFLHVLDYTGICRYYVTYLLKGRQTFMIFFINVQVRCTTVGDLSLWPSHATALCFSS